MYIMFKPDWQGTLKSCYIPCQVVKWNYKGTATYDPDLKAWGLSDAGQDAVGPANTLSHPTWKGNSMDEKYVEDKGP
jgi:hypothetical protein